MVLGQNISPRFPFLCLLFPVLSRSLFLIPSLFLLPSLFRSLSLLLRHLRSPNCFCVMMTTLLTLQSPQSNPSTLLRAICLRIECLSLINFSKFSELSVVFKASTTLPRSLLLFMIKMSKRCRKQEYGFILAE